MGAIHRQTTDASKQTWIYRDVPLREYSGLASTGVTKQVLVGSDEGASDFVVRYFTVPPGGHTALDQHEHQHGVVIVQGKGRVLLGNEWHEIGAGDSVFTDTNEVHQFEAAGDQPLGFVCVIPTWAEQPDLRRREPAAATA
jgi:quercetin dioxygenase-like cupin family protein